MSPSCHSSTLENSTIAAASGIALPVATLFFRSGRLHCPGCDVPLDWQQNIATLSRVILAVTGNVSIRLCAPVLQGSVASERHVSEFVVDGFSHVWIDGERFLLSEIRGAILADAILLETMQWQETPKDTSELRLKILQTLCLGRGCAVLQIEGRPDLRAGELGCDQCGAMLPMIRERLFSQTCDEGRCPGCSGCGRSWEIDVNALVRDSSRSLSEGAIAPWREGNNRYYEGLLLDLCDRTRIPFDSPWSTLGAKAHSILLYGLPDDDYRGVIADMEKRLSRWSGKPSDERDRLLSYCRTQDCLQCGKSGFGEAAEAIQSNGLKIGEVYRWSLATLPENLADMLGSVPHGEKVLALTNHLRDKVNRLSELGHLRLGDRIADISLAEQNCIREFQRSQR